MPRHYAPYRPVAERRFDTWFQERFATPVEAPPREAPAGAGRRPQPSPNTDALTKTFNYDQDTPCPGTGQVFGCWGGPVRKVYLVHRSYVLAAGIPLSVLESTTEFTTLLCDSCMYLWYSGKFHSRVKTRWVARTMAHAHISPAGARRGYKESFGRLAAVLAPRSALAEAKQQELQALVVRFTWGLGEPFPDYPNSYGLSQIDFRKAPYMFQVSLWPIAPY